MSTAEEPTTLSYSIHCSQWTTLIQHDSVRPGVLQRSSMISEGTGERCKALLVFIHYTVEQQRSMESRALAL